MVDEFLRRGWFVFATMRRAESRQELLAKPLQAYPDHLRLLELDVTSSEHRSAAVEAVTRHGGLDCLVSNAGYGTFGALENFSEEQLREVFETNFFGAVLLTRACLPLLREREGSLVIVSSVFGVNGFPLTSTYCATKFALEGLAESLYFELAPHGVQVSVIEPGANVTAFGKNVVWGQASVEAYRGQTESYHRLKKNIASKGTNHSRRIAAVAADLGEKRRRSFRNLVGSDAYFGAYFRRFVPDWIGLRLSKILFGRLFRSNA
jgi:NAD(P)-dependent dehydrogenase (short-subunit alcohol dehydrogenase family)